MRRIVSTLLVSSLALTLASCASVPSQDQLVSGIDQTKLAQTTTTKRLASDPVCTDFYSNIAEFQKSAQAAGAVASQGNRMVLRELRSSKRADKKIIDVADQRQKWALESTDYLGFTCLLLHGLGSNASPHIVAPRTAGRCSNSSLRSSLFSLFGPLSGVSFKPGIIGPSPDLSQRADCLFGFLSSSMIAATSRCSATDASMIGSGGLSVS